MVDVRTEDALLATQWLDHCATTWAWEALDDLIGSDPDRAWRIILAMVAYAPDDGTLAAVAAGPVEDLLRREEYFARAAAEATGNPRLLQCLRLTYLQLPPDLGFIIDDRVGTSLPPPTPDDMKLIFAWFHRHNTFPATQLVAGIIERHGDRAAAVIELLITLAADKTELLDDVLLFALEPFVRAHFATHNDALVALARRHSAVRTWLTEMRNLLVDLPKWTEFVARLSP